MFVAKRQKLKYERETKYYQQLKFTVLLMANLRLLIRYKVKLIENRLIFKKHFSQMPENCYIVKCFAILLKDISTSPVGRGPLVAKRCVQVTAEKEQDPSI